MKRRSRMDLNSIKRTILAAVCVLALSSVNAVAQEIRSEISLQGTGVFTKDADGNWIRQHATDTGGFVYGAGVDYAFTRHISLRAEYRGYVYKAPDFNLAGLNTDSWTHIAQPSAGIVFRF